MPCLPIAAATVPVAMPDEAPGGTIDRTRRVSAAPCGNAVGAEDCATGAVADCGAAARGNVPGVAAGCVEPSAPPVRATVPPAAGALGAAPARVTVAATSAPWVKDVTSAMEPGATAVGAPPVAPRSEEHTSELQ